MSDSSDVRSEAVPGLLPTDVSGRRPADRAALAAEHGRCSLCLDSPDVTYCGRCGRDERDQGGECCNGSSGGCGEDGCTRSDITAHPSTRPAEPS